MVEDHGQRDREGGEEKNSQKAGSKKLMRSAKKKDAWIETGEKMTDQGFRVESKHRLP